jgi:ribonuclease T1
VGLAAALLACGPPAADAGRSAAPAATATVSVSQLPTEAQQTLQLIHRGGPFPSRKDGAVFVNREQLLPQRPRGYYTEYTVRTPDARDRGARRIVAGRGTDGDPATSGEYYYTEDHYNTFRRIRE